MYRQESVEWVNGIFCLLERKPEAEKREDV
jgi:hypothetical protein